MNMEKTTVSPQVTEETLKAFAAGICYDIYDKLGAHPTVMDGVRGVYFAVWAPGALSVSVSGDFNGWSRESHPMKELGGSGVYELFVPSIEQGALYKYAVTSKSGETELRTDPYGTYAETGPDGASIVWDTGGYRWTDEPWLKMREEENVKEGPVSICQIHLGALAEKVSAACGEYNYRKMAEFLAPYIKDMGYTHVELLPVMEYVLDASRGFQTTGYYAPTSRFGTPEDFQYFIDYMHKHEIGVILDWVPSHFPKNREGLARFDGTCVYEHLDPRQGETPRWGTLLFNYGRPQVSDFLIANALYWVDKFHADGIRVSSMALMLYLDYGKQPGQWIPNLYGENENLEAVEFLKHLASIFHKRTQGTLLIAEESEMWARVTGDLKDGALGFDYKWNLGWSSDFLRYMKYAPRERSRHYSEMTYSMLYAYSEDFIVGFTHDDAAQGKMLSDSMPGDTEGERLANLRAAYGYWMTHPGRKILFMEQDGGKTDSGTAGENTGRGIYDYVKALNRLYGSHPALYQLDSDPDGFEWIDCLNSRENIIAFLRKSRCVQETLLVICNFGQDIHRDYPVGVPFSGIWQEILSSDDEKFGGSGIVNRRAIAAQDVERDGREHSIAVDVAPFSTHIFMWKGEGE